MATATRRLAKRQLTWLRAEPEVQWYAPAQERDIERVMQEFFERTRQT
jgi:tRNA dimethylallyltransferase